MFFGSDIKVKQILKRALEVFLVSVLFFAIVGAIWILSAVWINRARENVVLLDIDKINGAGAFQNPELQDIEIKPDDISYGTYELKSILEPIQGRFEGISDIYYKDLLTGTRIEIGDRLNYPPASTFKLYTAILTLRSVEAGDISMGAGVKLSPGLFVSGVGTYYKEDDIGSVYSVANILRQMIVLSDNTAQSMLFALLGRDHIEDRLKNELGLTSTSLDTFLTTVYDMGKTLENVYQHQVLSAENSTYLLNLLKKTQITDRIRKGVPEGTIVANKGGTLDGYKHDAAIIYSPSGPYILVVFTHYDNEQKSVEFIQRVSSEVWNYRMDRSLQESYEKRSVYPEL